MFPDSCYATDNTRRFMFTKARSEFIIGDSFEIKDGMRDAYE